MQEIALSLLRKALNNPNAQFREGQWEAITKLIKTKSRLLVVQRTGWGKSLVYFLSTKLLRNQGAGVTLLISPLLALMRNQIEAAQRMGVKATTINSTNFDEWKKIEQKLLADEIDILLISPERLANEEFRNNILIPLSRKIGLFVVDEAHCISDWGHDFRPDYRRIVRILQALPPTIPILATTATANNRVIDDIKAQLGSSLEIIRGNLTRKSLQLQNFQLHNPAERMAWLAENLPKIKGSGIIYTLTVRDAENVANWLVSQNINAQYYHSQLENNVRETLENQLLNNEIKALVATTALGMGFDKPDLAFVIHYQRPSSVVHYYQQVGRAGRAVSQAYGILLGGEEDDEIANFFIENAFPPIAHTQLVLDTLNQASNGLSVYELQEKINLSHGKIDKVLKLLTLDSPSPITKQGSKWYATPVNYYIDTQKIELLKQIRYQEQKQMQDYMNSQSCLMFFLASALDDQNPSFCGKCSLCLNQDLLPINYSPLLLSEALKYLRRTDYKIEPRKRWALAGAFPQYGFSGNIKTDLQAEEGRALCLWGDAGWGSLVKDGKYKTGYFDEQLVDATVEMIKRWQPKPLPGWITCVPSLKRTELVPNFAQRVADKLGIPFLPVVSKVKQNPPQKTMNNSYQQARNLDGVFVIDQDKIRNDAVFLIDDFIDSGWTFTVVSALLRKNGSGQVFPLALALNSLK
ncbi:RecQ family ATP-dependent DNA helicase [Geminocystis sp. CENA526]|uniref:RecQ family ATP-dependent DNA helicase n=1 Tax=Geminocystis sp. CENA526 TaxID=1355871 RepID=UPI003D6EF0AA